MKILIFFLFYLMISNCSLDKNSKYWTENNLKKNNSKKLIKIIKKSNDIRLMTVDEYKIYMDDYIKKSKYPELN